MFKKLWQSLFSKKEKPTAHEAEQVKEITPESTQEPTETISPPNHVPELPKQIHAPEPSKPVDKPKSSKHTSQIVRKLTPDFFSKPSRCKKKGIQQIIVWDDSIFPFRWRVRTIRHY